MLVQRIYLSFISGTYQAENIYRFKYKISVLDLMKTLASFHSNA